MEFTAEQVVSIVTNVLSLAGIYFGLKRTIDLIIEQTVGLRGAFDANTRQLKAVVHYLKWSIEKQTGGAPPPPLPIEDTD